MKFVVEKLGYYGVLKDLSAVQSVMISFTSIRLASCVGGYNKNCGRWMKGFTMC